MQVIPNLNDSWDAASSANHEIIFFSFKNLTENNMHNKKKKKKKATTKK